MEHETLNSVACKCIRTAIKYEIYCFTEELDIIINNSNTKSKMQKPLAIYQVSHMSKGVKLKSSVLHSSGATTEGKIALKIEA